MHATAPDTMISLDGIHRYDRTWAEYEAREKELEASRQRQSHVERVKQPRELLNPTEKQLELFETNPDDYDLIERWLKKLPRKRQREHFRAVYLREYHSVKNDGSIAFACGNKQSRHAKQYLRELLEKRINLVLKQYDFSVSWLELNYERIDEFYRDNIKQREPFNPLTEKETKVELPRRSILEIAKSLKPRRTEKLAKLPFFMIALKKLEDYANTLSQLLGRQQLDFIEQALETNADDSAILVGLYQKQGEFCQEIGFPLRHWDRHLEDKPIKPEQIDTALAEIACNKYWVRRMKKEQKRQLEHIAIACGEVQKKVSPYISKSGLADYKTSVKKSWDFLQAMIIENVEDPTEQIELFDIWKKSASNPDIRRKEMMTRLRGIEEWAEVNDQHCLFLTLTAPSMFHAQLESGVQNKKWNGANPRQTHQYLNKVWKQFRALLAKRKIDFHGMRVAEPHHDGTPHWHILFFVNNQHRNTVVELFKAKALELNGKERGAKTHRARVEDCDPEQGTPTGYIAKYISKNIRGFAFIDEMSDEITNFSFADNSVHATAWSRLWGIRQFQFFGASSIGVWRELRRLIKGDLKDNLMEELRICADTGESAAYLDRQGGAGAPRKAQLAVLAYQETDTNRYGMPTRKIIGIKNQQTGEITITRKKKFSIKKRPDDFIPVAERSEVQNGGLARPWTCVSNCNRSENERLLINELKIVMGAVNDHQFDYFLSGKKLFITHDRYAQLINNHIVIEKYQKSHTTTANGDAFHLQRLRNIGRQLKS